MHHFVTKKDVEAVITKIRTVVPRKREVFSTLTLAYATRTLYPKLDEHKQIEDKMKEWISLTLDFNAVTSNKDAVYEFCECMRETGYWNCIIKGKEGIINAHKQLIFDSQALLTQFRWDILEFLKKRPAKEDWVDIQGLIDKLYPFAVSFSEFNERHVIEHADKKLAAVEEQRVREGTSRFQAMWKRLHGRSGG